MGKVTSEILKKYCVMDENENGDCTILGLVKWNGREPKGYDIRKYNKENDAVFKGITISYDGMDILVNTAIENGLVDIDKVRDTLSKFDDKVFSTSDFKKMFMKIDEEEKNFKRDKHGILRDGEGHIVISRRIK